MSLMGLYDKYIKDILTNAKNEPDLEKRKEYLENELDYFEVTNTDHTDPAVNVTIKKFNRAIDKVEKQILKEENNEPTITGLCSPHNADEIKIICRQLIKEDLIQCKSSDFEAIFSCEEIVNYKTITWLIENPKRKGMPNKTALFVFLEKMLSSISNQALKMQIPILFKDKKGDRIEIKSRPSRLDKESINYFENISFPNLPDHK